MFAHDLAMPWAEQGSAMQSVQNWAQASKSGAAGWGHSQFWAETPLFPSLYIQTIDLPQF